MKPAIGLIGLGLMGRPMGMNLLKAGYSLTVWNRTASRADELVAAGAKLAKSPQELAANSEFLLTMVSDPPALEEVLWGPSGAMQAIKTDSIYVDSSTISPALARKIAAACAERGVRFLDAPVTGGDWGAKKGELLFMIGGDAATLKDAEPVLGVMGKKWFHLGPNGAGQTIKLAMNLILALQVDALPACSTSKPPICSRANTFRVSRCASCTRISGWHSTLPTSLVSLCPPLPPLAKRITSLRAPARKTSTTPPL